MDRKKELKQQYKQMRPAMGVFVVRSVHNNKGYLEAVQDLKSRINSTKFKLAAGNLRWTPVSRHDFRYFKRHHSIQVVVTLENNQVDVINKPRSWFFQYQHEGVFLVSLPWLWSVWVTRSVIQVLCVNP